MLSIIGTLIARGLKACFPVMLSKIGMLFAIIKISLPMGRTLKEGVSNAVFQLC